MLYLSLYFKTHRQYYYELLNDVRLSGNWEAWLDFFAEAVIITADQAVDTTRHLTDLSKGDRDKISGLGRAAASTLQIHRGYGDVVYRGYGDGMGTLFTNCTKSNTFTPP